MNATTFRLTAFGVLILASAGAYSLFQSRSIAQTQQPQKAVPLRHDPQREQFWNSHLLKLVRQGKNAKFISDGRLPGFTFGYGPKGSSSTTKLLGAGGSFMAYDRHGYARYQMRSVQRDGVILECYEEINLMSFGENRIAAARTWMKLKWR